MNMVKLHSLCSGTLKLPQPTSGLQWHDLIAHAMGALHI